MQRSEELIKEHHQRASKVFGMRINGTEYVTLQQALQMTELTSITFHQRCRVHRIVPRIDENGKKRYEKQKILNGILTGFFEKYMKRK